MSMSKTEREQLEAAGERIVEGHGRLVNGKYVESLECYTNVLSDIAPGHAGAYLSRTLSYLMLSYPCLAAMDAWKAIYIADLAMEDEPENVWRDQIYKYSKLGFIAENNREPWTIRPTCFVGRGKTAGLNNKLASINIHVTTRKKSTDPRTELYSNVCYAIKMKAYYLLALALYQLGGGAMRSALDIIADAMALYICTPDDREEFENLEKEIYWTIKKQSKLEAATQQPGTLPLIQNVLNMRYTRVIRRLHPWDNCGIGSMRTEPEAVKRLSKKILKPPSAVRIEVLDREEKAQRLRIHADRDVTDTEDLFSERSALHVASVDPTWMGRDPICDSCGAELVASRSLLKKAQTEAHTHTTVDDLNETTSIDPDDSVESIEASRTQSSSSPMPSSSPEHMDTPLSPGPQNGGAEGKQKRHPNSRSSGSSATLVISDDTQVTPSKAMNLENRSGFRMCSGCKDVVYCSSTCEQLSTSNYHRASCDMNLESWISNSVPHYELTGLPGPHEQRITVLLLLRLVAHLHNKNTHPLEHPWLQSLPTDFKEPSRHRSTYTHGRAHLQHCFPDLYDPSSHPHTHPDTQSATSHLTPWSFETNVRKPFNILLMIGGPELAVNTTYYDGWIINTILARISENVTITYGPRFEKAFKHDGTLLSQRTLPRREVIDPCTFEEEGLRVMGDDYDAVRWRERQMWSGSLYQLASLVQVAKDDELANVILYERNGTMVCRPKTKADVARKDSVADIAANGTLDASKSRSLGEMVIPIKAGDVLLREKEIRVLTSEEDCVDESYDWSSGSEYSDDGQDMEVSEHMTEEMARDITRALAGEIQDEEMLEDGDIV